MDRKGEIGASDRRVVVIRHAKSSWDDPTLRDHDRPLAKRGENALAGLHRHIENLQLEPQLVLCSSSRRTSQTLDGIRDVLGPQARISVESTLYGADAEQLLDVLRGLGDEISTVFLIGHNPGAVELISLLAADPTAASAAIGKFPTAAVAVLSFPGPWSALQPSGAALVSSWAPRTR